MKIQQKTGRTYHLDKSCLFSLYEKRSWLLRIVCEDIYLEYETVLCNVASGVAAADQIAGPAFNMFLSTFNFDLQKLSALSQHTHVLWRTVTLRLHSEVSCIAASATEVLFATGFVENLNVVVRVCLYVKNVEIDTVTNDNF